MRRVALSVASLLLAAAAAAPQNQLLDATRGKQPVELPHALTQMVEAERAFAARALVVGWKRSFLEFFADDAMGFAKGEAGLPRQRRPSAGSSAHMGAAVWRCLGKW
jgi:hypothetical protein